MSTIEIPPGGKDEWLGTLKQYQRVQIDALLVNSDERGAAEKWLASSGSDRIAPFGGESNPKPFFDLFMTEVRRFLCDDAAYVEEKANLKKHGIITHSLFVATIAGAIGSTLGFAAALLSPAVALMLIATAKMGLKAFCESCLGGQT